MNVIKKIEQKIRENKRKAEYWRGKLDKYPDAICLVDSYEELAREWEKIKEMFIKEAKEIVKECEQSKGDKK